MNTCTIVLLLVLVSTYVGIACSAAPTPVPTTPTPTNMPMSPTDTLTPVPAQQATLVHNTDSLRQLTFAYWDALNSYNAEKTLSYLEGNYRQAHRGEVEKGIKRMKMFGVKLGVSEESPPRIKGANEAEMYVALKEPLGIRRILMKFAMVEGEWKITFAEEVE